MKASLLTYCFVSASLLAQAQTAKPKITSGKPVATVHKATPTKKPVTARPVVASKPTAKPQPAVARPVSATTATVAQAAPVQTTAAAPAPTAATTQTRTTAQTAKPSKPLNMASQGKGLSVGLRLGGNVLLNSFAEATEEGGKVKRVPGFGAGLILNYGFSELFSVQPEVLYTRRSIKATTDYEGETYLLQMDANSVEIPILLKASFGKGPRFFVNAGPYVNYALSGRLTAKGGGESQTQTIKYGENDARLEYGVTGGVGATLPLGPGSLLLEGRFTYGLGNNAQVKADEYGKVASFSFGYLLPLGR